MAVEIIAGLLGGGKTYYGVSRMLAHLGKGGTVVTNITLKREPWQNERYHKKELGLDAVLLSRHKWVLQPDQIIHMDNDDIANIENVVPWGEVDSKVLVVLDEALDYFDSLDRGDAATSRKRFFAWIRRVRKFNVDIVFVTQVHGQLNNRLRSLAAVIWAVEDMAEWRAPGWGFPFPFPWMFRRRQIAPDGKTVIKTTYDTKDFRIFGCYQTDEIFDGWKAPRIAKRLTSGLVQNIKELHMIWKASIVVLGILVITLLFRSPAASNTAELTSYIDSVISNTPPQFIALAETDEEPKPRTVSLNLSLLDQRVFVGGQEVITGDILPPGIVLAINSRKLTVQRWDGSILHLIPGRKTTYRTQPQDNKRGMKPNKQAEPELPPSPYMTFL